MTRELFAAYSVEGYDLTLAAPELACALLANAILVPAPIADVLAHASIGGKTQRHAWITLIDRPREGDEAAFPAVMLVTATQVAPSSVDEDFLRTTLRSFAEALPPTPPKIVTLPLEARTSRGGRTRIITRPHPRSSFRPERLFIDAVNDQDWIIHNITIGNRSQFLQDGSIPGDMFRTDAIEAFVSFETVQPAMDIVVDVGYIGSHASTLFAGRLVGQSVYTGQHANTAISLHNDVTSAILQADALLRSDLSAQLGAHA